MSKCVFPLLLVPLIAACSPSAEPQPAEIPVQPLVIGTSPPPSSGTPPVPPEHIEDAPIATAPATSLAVPARDPRLARKVRVPTLIDPNIDEGHYYAGLEHEMLGISRKHGSPSTSLFLSEAATDPPKYDLAQQACLEVMKYPAPANVVLADTLFRLGEVHDRKGETAKANAMYARLQREFPNSSAAGRARGAPAATRP